MREKTKSVTKKIDEKKDVLDDFDKVFEVFINRYKSTYGDKKMDGDTATMFYDRLCDIDPEKFEKVTTTLLGSYPWYFQWAKVIERVAIMYPTAINQHNLEKLWKLKHDQDPQKDKKTMLGQLQSAVPDLKKSNPTGWREDYFKKHIEIMGIEESTKIAQDIQEFFPEFKEWIYKTYQNGQKTEVI